MRPAGLTFWLVHMLSGKDTLTACTKNFASVAGLLVALLSIDLFSLKHKKSDRSRLHMQSNIRSCWVIHYYSETTWGIATATLKKGPYDPSRGH